jgi:hypothetical protein
MLLVIHGGRRASSNPHLVPVGVPGGGLAAEGYVLPGQSARLGIRRGFRRGNEKTGAAGLSGPDGRVDKVIAMGIADPDRLGVMGWSYGGFMTLGHHADEPVRGRAVGAGVTNLASFGTTDIPSFVPDYFGGEFWDGGPLRDLPRTLRHGPCRQREDRR